MQVNHSARPALEAEITRLTKENSRLTMNAEKAEMKKAELFETIHAVMGLINDDPVQLNKALRSNRFRENGFQLPIGLHMWRKKQSGYL